MPSGAVAITVTTTALVDRVSGVVCGDACVPGFGCGLARESVGGVGFVRLVCEVLVSVSCVPAPPGVFVKTGKTPRPGARAAARGSRDAHETRAHSYR